MEFSQLSYFRAAARHGNLTRAAEELHVSQPGLSRYLSRLEEELGVPLFERRKGRIALNTYGQVFLANVDLAFGQLERGAEAVRQMYTRDLNILSVACSIEDFLIDRLKDFSPVHPEIGIRQYAGTIPEMQEQLLRRNLDLMICAHPVSDPAIRYEQLSQCPYVLLCRRDDPLAAWRSLRLRQAAGETFVCENSRMDRRRLTALCQTLGFTPKVSHEVENGYILFNLLRNGMGVAIVPLAHYLQLEAHYPDHGLRALPLEDGEIPPAEIGVAYLPGQGDLGSAGLFLDYLRESSRQEAEAMAQFLRREGEGDLLP